MTASDFLGDILASLVQHPELLKITEKHDELGVLLSVEASSSDMWLIIGRGGKTIDSLRIIMRVYGAKHEQRVNIRLIEEKS